MTDSLLHARVTHLAQTCAGCPSQWEGSLDNGHAIYIRYRWGLLQIGAGHTLDDAVLSTISPRDGECVEMRIGGEYDGYLDLGELIAAAACIAPGLDFAGVHARAGDRLT